MKKYGILSIILIFSIFVDLNSGGTENLYLEVNPSSRNIKSTFSDPGMDDYLADKIRDLDDEYEKKRKQFENEAKNKIEQIRKKLSALEKEDRDLFEEAKAFPVPNKPYYELLNNLDEQIDLLEKNIYSIGKEVKERIKRLKYEYDIRRNQILTTYESFQQ